MTDPRQQNIPEELGDLPGYGREAAPEATYIAEGKPAEHEWGVQYQGSFEGEADGTARAVRLHARALAATGLPVKLQSFNYQFRGADGTLQGAEATSERVKKEVHALVHASVGRLRVRIKHAVIFGPDYLRSWIIPKSVMLEGDPVVAQAQMQGLYKQTIVYSVWERTTIDPNITGILRRCGECWVPSTHNAELLRAHGIERVTVVPHPWEPDSPLARAIGYRAPLSEKRFYAIGIWQPRKGFHELLGAFLTAFRPGDRAHLTIKYKEFHWPKYPTPDESVGYWLTDPAVHANGWRVETLAPHVALREKFWPDEKIQELHLASNIYVSCSRGEAFGLPAFDAKLCGNRMIYIPWGGPQDFADVNDWELPFKLEPAADSYRWEAGAEWASIDFGALVHALKNIQAPERYARNAYVESCRFDRVGALMRTRVESVLAGSAE